MKHLMKRSFALLMALVLVFSLLPGISLDASAATVNYQYGSTGKYSNVIKNWGARGEIATFLSPNAEEFYSETTYEELIALNGSSSLTAVDTSPLYVALYQLMSDAHTTKNSYEDSKDLFQYTDCQTNGSPSDKISAFYSGEEVGPAWDSGSTWNREHTWPNSKGGASSSDGGGVNEVDIMMLRPETSSNNSSRGNKAYGESSAYFFPNLSDDYDVRGDAARTILYVYVRWGTEESEVLNNMWGSDGVMESLDVLLTWMEEDPVDTWEMGRNDSVQSITGTRNVFVDYPELAFELFEQTVPEMVTPSGNAGGTGYTITAKTNNAAYGTVSLSGNVITAVPAAGYEVSGYQVTSGSAKVTQNGNTFTVAATSDCTVMINFKAAAMYTVQVKENGILKVSQQVQSGNSYTLPAFSGSLPEGYTFCGWTTDTVTGSKPTLSLAGASVKITANTTYYAVASYFDGDAGSTDKNWVLVTSASQIGAGSEVIIAAKDYDYAMSTTQNGNNRGQAAIVKTDNGMTYESAVAVFTLETGTVSGSYGFNTGNGYLNAVKNSSNYLRTQTSLDEKASFYITVSSDGTSAITSAAFVSGTSGVGNVPMQYNTQGMFSCYPKATQKPLSLYVAESAGGSTVYTTAWESGVCTHGQTSTVTVNATCTTNGSVTVTCDDCGEIISSTVLPAGHREVEREIPATLSQEGYTLLYCENCGEELGRENIEDPLTNVEGWSLTLGSDLSVNFKINVDASIVSTAKISISVASGTSIYAVSDLTAGEEDSYLVSMKVSAPQMTDRITVQIINGNDQTEARNYTVKGYAETILAGNYSVETKNLVTQMLHYGAAAQIYFGYKADDLANAGLSASVQSTPETTNVVTAGNPIDGIEFYGATLMFRNRLAVRYYFTVTGNISDYTFTANGASCTPVRKGDYYYVEIGNINPQDLDEVITVKVNDTYSITYSGLNYIVNIRQSGSEKMQALVQALYDYYLAAEAYLAA